MKGRNLVVYDGYCTLSRSECRNVFIPEFGWYREKIRPMTAYDCHGIFVYAVLHYMRSMD